MWGGEAHCVGVVEHRLIPARVRSEWTRLRAKSLASIWAPASQDSSHVGNASVGVVRGVPIAGHAHWAEVGGGIFCVTLREFTGLHKSAPYVFRVMEVVPFIGVGGFNAREKQKVPVRAIVEGDLFLSARSSFFFFLLSSFVSHPESCLKLRIFMKKKKNDVLGDGRRTGRGGRGREAPGRGEEEGGGAKRKRMKKKKRKNEKARNTSKKSHKKHSKMSENEKIRNG